MYHHNQQHTHADDTEIYRIAMILCPHRKMTWFSQNEWPDEWISAARQTIYTRWSETYKPLYEGVRAAATTSTAAEQPKHSKWRCSINDLAVKSALEEDTLDAYLEAPVVPVEVIDAAGGLLAYWESQRAKRPRLAQMALDFLTAPASSVDAERAFSGGRLQVNHMQHNISSQAFRAKMVLGSWYRAPWMPTVADCAAYLGGKKGAQVAAADKQAAQNAREVIEID
ncbi:hypothetical protein AURDEDRAFT_174551 [Auricularia subglabra TFB-10046 SS5]|uniref:HAT C-terminal dimerisation domain-containing protein n=1 Tax=Auricularia subglabra (strain TFB-10046 / SS5) TaxID=717982 RepID=J0WUA8_AURST|nr:hypothetical protein AURDEDRAFT_174551 [Auricularia subglabra TFB-10046 SS5]